MAAKPTKMAEKPGAVQRVTAAATKEKPPNVGLKVCVCLEVPDDYAYMDPELVGLLWERIARIIPALAIHKPV